MKFNIKSNHTDGMNPYIVISFENHNEAKYLSSLCRFQATTHETLQSVEKSDFIQMLKESVPATSKTDIINGINSEESTNEFIEMFSGLDEEQFRAAIRGITIPVIQGGELIGEKASSLVFDSPNMKNVLVINESPECIQVLMTCIKETRDLFFMIVNSTIEELGKFDSGTTKDITDLSIKRNKWNPSLLFLPEDAKKYQSFSLKDEKQQRFQALIDVSDRYMLKTQEMLTSLESAISNFEQVYAAKAQE